MKQVRNQVKALLVGCMCIALLAGNCFGAEPDDQALAAKKLLTAIEANDYDSFIAQGEPAFKVIFTKQLFLDVSAQLAPRMKKGYDSLYLGSFKRQGYVIYLWKLIYKDSGDDTLAFVSLKNGAVAGFWQK
jgi:hypothetical protein